MKLKSLYGFTLIILIMFPACFSPWKGDETASLIISFSGDSRYSESVRNAGWPPTEDNNILPFLQHRITLSSHAGKQQVHNIESGAASAVFTVTPGKWDINVEAFIGDVHYAAGSSYADAIAGQSCSVTIMMTQAFEDDMLFVIRNDDDWEEAMSVIGEVGDGKSCLIILAGDITVSGIEEIDTQLGDTAYSFNEKQVNVTITGNYTMSLSTKGSMFVLGTAQSVTLQDVKLRGVSANDYSVVYLDGGSFNMKGSSAVFGNKGDSCNGGGVYVNGVELTSIFNMYSGSIYGNLGSNGGGVFITGTNSTFNMYGGSIYGNSSGNNGGGVYVTGKNSTFNMYGGVIGGDIFEDKNIAISGGGVYVADGGNFNMTGGTITGNKATNYTNPGGGGICIYSFTKNPITFNMSGNAIISGNEAGNGGGVYISTGTGGNQIFSSATFNMSGGSIYGNKATRNSEGSGGGVYISSSGGSSGTPSVFFYMSGGTISGNIAEGDFSCGGGVYVNQSGTSGSMFTMSGNASVSGNNAVEGGGVYVNGNYATFKIQGGIVYGTDESHSLSNTHSALYVFMSETVQYGPSGFEEDFNDNPTIGVYYITDTIKVMNGVLQGGVLINVP